MVIINVLHPHRAVPVIPVKVVVLKVAVTRDKVAAIVSKITGVVVTRDKAAVIVSKITGAVVTRDRVAVIVSKITGAVVTRDRVAAIITKVVSVNLLPIIIILLKILKFPVEKKAGKNIIRNMNMKM